MLLVFLISYMFSLDHFIIIEEKVDIYSKYNVMPLKYGLIYMAK